MAQTGKAFFFKLVLLLSLLLMISVAQSVNLGFGKQDAALSCNSIYGAESGDTCSSVAKAFNLSLEDFLSFNPNVNCDKIFVGQWLCLATSA